MLLSSVDIVNKASLVHNFSKYVYFFSVHVSGDYVPIIRRSNCIQLYYFNLRTNHPYRITSNKCRINTFVSPDDKHRVAGNMQRKEINILRKIVHPVGFINCIIQGFTVNRT